jgi:hypothetical protein
MENVKSAAIGNVHRILIFILAIVECNTSNIWPLYEKPPLIEKRFQQKLVLSGDF